MTLCDTAKLLAPTIRERSRILAPSLLAAIVFFVAAAGPLGIRPPDAWWAMQWVPTGMLAVLCVALARRWIPERWIHLASAAPLWCAFAAALLGFAGSREPAYLLILSTLIASTGVLLHVAYAVGTLAGALAIAIPLVTRTASPNLALPVAMLLTAAAFALMINALMRQALVRVERLRESEAAQSRVLADQVDALERAQRERAALHDQLLHAQRLEAIGTLAAGFAHDMNNVLASIVGLSDLAAEVTTEECIRQDLDQIRAQAERGGAMTRGLLAFSRRGQYRKRILRLDEQVEEVLGLLRQTLAKSLDIRADRDIDGLHVDADPVQLHQVLVNLGLNAADAMSNRGTLTLRARRVDIAGAAIPGLAAGPHVELAVTDTGTGMDEATRARLFEPFFTTKPQHEGTGLGLAIVWGIVQAHGGAVQVDTAVGRGTTFRIYLPLANRAPTTREIARIPATLPPPPRMTVLVVDDEPLIRDTTKRLLARAGIEALTAANGVDALAVLDTATQDIALVILDMKMPVMGGAECFHKIRERSDVPVLVATGYATDTEAQELVAAGAALIEKPFGEAALREQIERLHVSSTAAAS